MREYLLCMLAAAAVTFLTTNLARAAAIRAGAIAEVRDRDVHDAPTPRWGGLAMFAGLVAGIVLAAELPLLSAVFQDSDTMLALLEGCAIIVVIGLVDDRYGLDAATKLAGQVLAAGVMAVQGISLIWLTFGYDMLPLLFPLASGFALVGPVAAVGLYEMSRLREQGIRITWVDAFDVVRSPGFAAILVLGLVLLAFRFRFQFKPSSTANASATMHATACIMRNAEPPTRRSLDGAA